MRSKHGIAELPSGGLLRISAELQNEMLNLEVENPRPPTPIPTAHEGVGLRNARDRLRLLFGARAGLDLDLSKPAVTTARLRVPRTPMKAMIIDDEPPARRELRRLLADFSWVEVVGEAGNVDHAAEMVEWLTPELLFLDIQMPGGSGFDLLTPTGALPAGYFHHCVQ